MLLLGFLGVGHHDRVFFNKRSGYPLVVVSILSTSTSRKSNATMCTYVGETGRTLQKCLSEHRSAVRKNDRKNGIAVHAWDKGHQVKWESAKVKELETNLANRRIMEALHIQQLPHTTNLDCGLTIDPCLASPPVLTLTPYPPCLRSLYLKSSLLSQPDCVDRRPTSIIILYKMNRSSI